MVSNQKIGNVTTINPDQPINGSSQDGPRAEYIKNSEQSVSWIINLNSS